MVHCSVFRDMLISNLILTDDIFYKVMNSKQPVMGVRLVVGRHGDGVGKGREGIAGVIGTAGC